MKTPLTFDSVNAISVGGSYTVGENGKAVRDDANSTNLASIAKGAPGTPAELNAAGDVGSPAHSEASAKSTAKKP